MDDTTMPGAPEVESEAEDKEIVAEPEAADESEVTEGEQPDEPEGETEETEEDGEPDEVELKVGGEVLKVPRDALPEDVREQVQKFVDSAEASYTRKFQDVAEQRKSVEARAEALGKIETLNTDTLNTYARGLAVKQELERLEAVDLSALWQSDPDEARRVSDYKSRMAADLNSIVSQVSRLEQQTSEAQTAEIQRLREEGEKLVEKRIPGFTEKASAVVEYMTKEYGLDPAVGKDWGLNPAYAEVAYKAMLYDRGQAKAKAAMKPKPAPAQPVRPIKGKGGGKPRYDLVADADKIPIEEWVRRERARTAKRAS